MKAIRNFVLASVSSLIALAPISQVASAAPATSVRPSAPTTSPAVLGFQGCVAGTTAPAHVLFLVDQTASLPITDPHNARALGLKAALRAMAQTTQTNAADRFNVQMVGFGKGVTPILTKWTPVTNASLPALYAKADRASRVAPGEQGYFTNFAAGLNYADQRLLSTPAGTCRAVLWFTDGVLDVTNDGTYFNAADKAAMGQICQANGIADSLVSDQISNFAVGLTTNRQVVKLPSGKPSTIGQLGAQSLASIVSGTPNYLYASGRCGALTSPATGAFFNAPQQADLIFQMQQLVCSGSDCHFRQEIPCVIGNVACPANSGVPFWVGPGIASFTLDGVSNIPTTQPLEVQVRDLGTQKKVTLRVVNGVAQCLPVQCALDGVRLSAAQSLRGVAEVRVVGTVHSPSFRHLQATYLVPAGSKNPMVQQIFYETSSVRLAIRLTGGGSTACPAPNGFVAYVSCTMKGEIIAKPAGGVLPSASQAGFTGLKLRLNREDVTSSLHLGTAWPVLGTFAIPIPKGTLLGSEIFQVNGVLNLGEHGHHYSAIELSTAPSLEIAAPPSYPAIVQQKSIPVVQVGQKFSVAIHVVPAVTGNGGCVTAGQPAWVGAKGLNVSDLHTTLPSECGEPLKSTYRISGTLEHGDDGRFALHIPVLLGSSQPGQAKVATEVVIVVRSNVPVNVAKSLLLLIALLLLGLLGVVAVAFGVNVATAKFPMLFKVMMRTVEVRYDVTRGELETPQGGTLELKPLSTADLVDPGATAKVSAFSKDGLLFEASAGRGPISWLLGLFTGPRAYVSASGSAIIVGPKDQTATTEPVEIPIDLNNLSIFRVTAVEATEERGDESMVSASPAVGSVRGALSILLLSGAGPDQLQDALETAKRRIKAHIEEVIALPQDAVSRTEPASAASAADSSFSIDDINI